MGRVVSRGFVPGHEPSELLSRAASHRIPPFEDRHKGTPFHDFTGRLADWPWPSQ